MNKYILRTSLIWLVILAATVALLLYRSHTHRTVEPSAQSAQVLAEGPGAQSDASQFDAKQPDSPTSNLQVSSHTPLAPVQLTADQENAIDLRIGSAEYKQISGDLGLTGTVAVDERLLSYVQVRFSGYIRKVFADANYQYVRKGESLFTIYSPELLSTQQEYLLAKQNERALASSTVEGVASGAAGLSAAAQQRLQQWDIPASELKRIEQTQAPITDMEVDSPVSGYVTERNAVPNLFVEPATRLYTIADLSRVWVNAEVFQNDAGRLKPGDTATVSVDAYPRRTFRARVEQILPQVDAATRTVQVRLTVENPALKLKPGMFVNVDLKSSAGRQLCVPSSAVFQTGTRQIVFLAEGKGIYEPRQVTLGAAAGDQVAVLSGLEPHQRIVTSANFLLDSESQLQAAAGAPAATNSAQDSDESSRAKSASIQFTTTPAPPTKGSNVFHVKLSEPNGTSIQDATVTVTFYMPAMPAMGMAAMKTSVRLVPKGNGAYEGSGELGSGGSWQVTVTAERNGQTIAMKQVRVDATGGM